MDSVPLQFTMSSMHRRIGDQGDGQLGKVGWSDGNAQVLKIVKQQCSFHPLLDTLEQNYKFKKMSECQTNAGNQENSKYQNFQKVKKFKMLMLILETC